MCCVLRLRCGKYWLRIWAQLWRTGVSTKWHQSKSLIWINRFSFFLPDILYNGEKGPESNLLGDPQLFWEQLWGVRGGLETMQVNCRLYGCLIHLPGPVVRGTRQVRPQFSLAKIRGGSRGQFCHWPFLCIDSATWQLIIRCTSCTVKLSWGEEMGQNVCQSLCVCLCVCARPYRACYLMVIHPALWQSSRAYFLLLFT